MGLSLALSSEITFEKGRGKQSNFHDYEVLRHHTSPRMIGTHLVNDNHAHPPGGPGRCNADRPVSTLTNRTSPHAYTLPLTKIARLPQGA